MLTEMQEIKLSNSKIFLDVFKPEDFEEIEGILEGTDDFCFFGDFFEKKEILERLNSRSILSNNEPSNIIWTIRKRDTDEAVGIAGFLPDQIEQESSQLVWFVCLDMIPKKYAASVVHLLIEYAFDFYKKPFLSVYVPHGQKKHKSVARQIGLKFQKFLWKDSKPIDYYRLYR